VSVVPLDAKALQAFGVLRAIRVIWVHRVIKVWQARHPIQVQQEPQVQQVLPSGPVLRVFKV
jgi:hypothetical protein